MPRVGWPASASQRFSIANVAAGGAVANGVGSAGVGDAVTAAFSTPGLPLSADTALGGGCNLLKLHAVIGIMQNAATMRILNMTEIIQADIARYNAGLSKSTIMVEVASMICFAALIPD